MSKKRQTRSSKRQTRTTSGTPRQSVRSTATVEEFNPDYSQTIKDLKRIGLLASSFFIILVTLAFFLR